MANIVFPSLLRWRILHMNEFHEWPSCKPLTAAICENDIEFLQKEFWGQRLVSIILIHHNYRWLKKYSFVYQMIHIKKNHYAVILIDTISATVFALSYSHSAISESPLSLTDLIVMVSHKQIKWFVWLSSAVITTYSYASIGSRVILWLTSDFITTASDPGVHPVIKSCELHPYCTTTIIVRSTGIWLLQGRDRWEQVHKCHGCCKLKLILYP